MLEKLSRSDHVVGLNQCRRAVKSRDAAAVFIAEDADARVRGQLTELCREAGTEIVPVPTMKELGEACGIEVGAAAAALLK